MNVNYSLTVLKLICLVQNVGLMEDDVSTVSNEISYPKS